MKDLSMHVMDIAQNSVSAGAKKILISVLEDIKSDVLCIQIEDDGKGMNQETLEKVTDPFFTTRTTRKVGLGLPLLKMNAEHCNGSFSILSQPGNGTVVTAQFQYSNIDRPTLGNMAETIVLLITANPEIEFLYRHSIDGKTYVFDTREIKEVLEGIPINDPKVYLFLKEMVLENLVDIRERG